MVNCASQLLYPWERPQYPLNRRLGGPQSWPGCYEEQKNFLPLWGFEPRTVQL
jgi:hypothetical protein